MVHKLIRIIPIIYKDINPARFIILQYCGSAGSRAALPIVTLADDIKSVSYCFPNKFSERRCFSKISFVGIAIIGKNFYINIRSFNIKNTFTNIAIINTFFSQLFLFVGVKKLITAVFVGKPVSFNFSIAFLEYISTFIGSLP